MTLCTAITVITLYLSIASAFAQSNAPPQEPIPGLGFCTEKEEKLLDRASEEYASVLYPKKRDENSQKKYDAYMEKMNKPRVMDSLLRIYMKCDRNMFEFLPPEALQD